MLDRRECVVRFCLEKCLLRSLFLLIARHIFLIPPLFESLSACELIVHSNKLSFWTRMYPTFPRSASFRPYRYRLRRWEPFPAQRVAVAKSSYFACFGVYSEKYRNSADCPSIG